MLPDINQLLNKKQLYKWHRLISVTIAIPVLLWAASGFMHPLMTNMRPKLVTQTLVPENLESSRIQVSLQKALQQNHLDSFFNFRLVHIDTNWFYQIQLKAKSPPVYLSATNGKSLPAGDWLYAQYLARQFLEGQAFSHGQSPPPAHVPAESPMKALPALYKEPEAHDCCGAATECVLNSPMGAKVTNVSLLHDFDKEYKSINRLMPVYRVNFDRADGIRVFVETTQDRFAFAMDDKRYVFDRIFTLIHTWGWLDFLGKGRLVVEFTLVLLAFLTTVMGIIIFFSTKSKPSKGNSMVKARRIHRFTSITIALFTLMFTFSGSVHLLSKFSDDKRDLYFMDRRTAASSVDFDVPALEALSGNRITNISLVYLKEGAYWQVNTPALNKPGSDRLPGAGAKDVLYIRTDSLSVLSRGEERYAGFLATRFSGHSENEILATTSVSRFNSEYNFSDKRLPVWKISYAGHGHERYFVETATGQLSKRLDDQSLLEDYSFAFLHKHEFMSWGGKGVKDLSTMFWALAQIVLVTVGLRLYVKRQKRTSDFC
ncbi:hypothetical protein ACX0G9_03960 [Flavitalea flava]